MRYPLREAALRRRRERVLIGFTAPALTAAMAGLAWAGTTSLGVGLAVVGAMVLAWNPAIRRVGRHFRVPEALWVTPVGIGFEPSRHGRDDPSGIVPWTGVVVFPTVVGGRSRYYLRWRAGTPGEAAAYVRAPDGAIETRLPRGRPEFTFSAPTPGKRASVELRPTPRAA